MYNQSRVKPFSVYFEIMVNKVAPRFLKTFQISQIFNAVMDTVKIWENSE